MTHHRLKGMRLTIRQRLKTPKLLLKVWYRAFVVASGDVRLLQPADGIQGN